MAALSVRGLKRGASSQEKVRRVNTSRSGQKHENPTEKGGGRISRNQEGNYSHNRGATAAVFRSRIFLQKEGQTLPHSHQNQVWVVRASQQEVVLTAGQEAGVQSRCGGEDH